MIWKRHDTATGEFWDTTWDVYRFRIRLWISSYVLFQQQGDDWDDVGMFDTLVEAQYAAQLRTRTPHLDVRGIE